MSETGTKSSYQIYRDIAASAIPASIGSLFSFLQETINLIFIGHKNDPILVAAVGSGNVIIMCCGIGMFYGLNSGLETLVSQAYGAKNMHLCGVYLQRGRICLTMLFIPILIVFAFSGTILKSLGQNPLVAESAQLYILSSIAGIYLMGLHDLQRKFLTQVEKSHLSMKV